MNQRGKSIGFLFLFIIFVFSELTECQTKKTCHKLKLVEDSADYTVEGSFIDFKGLKVYETKDKTPTRLLFCGYSSSGFNGPTRIRQISDRVADAGFRIAMPDFLVAPNAVTTVRELIAHYKAQGVKQFGFFGFCYGGGVAVQICQQFDEMQGGFLIHPAGVDTNDANTLKCPMFLMPSTSEQMDGFYDIMVKKFGKDKVGHRKVPLPHGFTGENVNQPAGRALIVEEITTMIKYFNARMPQ